MLVHARNLLFLSVLPRRPWMPKADEECEVVEAVAEEVVEAVAGGGDDDNGTAAAAACSAGERPPAPPAITTTEEEEYGGSRPPGVAMGVEAGVAAGVAAGNGLTAYMPLSSRTTGPSTMQMSQTRCRPF